MPVKFMFCKLKYSDKSRFVKRSGMPPCSVTGVPTYSGLLSTEMEGPSRCRRKRTRSSALVTSVSNTFIANRSEAEEASSLNRRESGGIKKGLPCTGKVWAKTGCESHRQEAKNRKDKILRILGG